MFFYEISIQFSEMFFVHKRQWANVELIIAEFLEIWTQQQFFIYQAINHFFDINVNSMIICIVFKINHTHTYAFIWIYYNSVIQREQFFFLI